MIAWYFWGSGQVHWKAEPKSGSCRTVKLTHAPWNLPRGPEVSAGQAADEKQLGRACGLQVPY